VRKILLLLSYLLALSPGPLEAQLDLLTVRESQSLVERIPAIVAAQKEGECPTLEPPIYGGSEQLSFGVRGSCGRTAGQLIGNYTVNRRTGAITLGIFEDATESAADETGKALATRLVREAQKRVLSTAEGQCLALEAAKALPGWDGTDATVSVQPFGKPDTFGLTMAFTATRRSTSRPVETGRLLTVFLREARVRDDETGIDVTSAKVGNLVAKFVQLRNPMWLSDEEATSVALTVPRVAANLQNGCNLYGGGAFYSHGALMGVFCKDRGVIRESNVLVDLQTGAVVDPDTGQSLDSAESQRVARQLLARIQARHAELQKEVDAACRAQ